MSTTTTLRRNTATLATLAARDLEAMWRQVTNAAQARRALEDILPALIETYGLAAAALAADWYDEARIKAGVGGSFQAFPTEIPNPRAEAASLLTWAQREAVSIETMPALVFGGVQRRLANAARGTVMGSAIADPKARGWKRVGNPRCGFCRMLISRGAVYSEATVHFDAHDSCNCAAAPEWSAT
jgi:hypothetical protein